MGRLKPMYMAAGALIVMLTGCGGSVSASNNTSSAQMQSNNVSASQTPPKTQQTVGSVTGNTLVASTASATSTQHNSSAQSSSGNHSSGGTQLSGSTNSTGASQSKGESTTQVSGGTKTTARVIHVTLHPDFSSGLSHCWIMPTSQLYSIFPSPYTLTGYEANIIGRGTFTTFDITASKLDAFDVGADGKSLWFNFAPEDAGHQVQFIFKGKDARGNTIEAQSQLFTVP